MTFTKVFVLRRPLDGTWEQESDVHQRRDDMVRATREEVESILTLAGLKPARMWELANDYWPRSPRYDGVRKPWWLAQTSLGLIKIGWRKKVMSIEWDATPIKTIVTTDEVTKSPTMVHAWSTAKAVEYLQQLRTVAEAK